MDDEFRLNDRAKAWIRGISGHYAGEPLSVAGSAPVRAAIENSGFKLL
jgi:hypothetical protein